MRVLLAALLLVLPVAAAQTPAEAAGLCFRAKPAPACKGFFIVSAGITIGPVDESGSSPLRMSADYGVMRNVGRNAYGGTWFAKFDQDGFSTGPAARLRRWLSQRASMDFAVGTVVASGGGFGSAGLLKPGSVLGLVKYSPYPYFGLVLRPEYIRREVFQCDVVTCIEVTKNGGRLYAGAEFDGMHGVVTSLVLGLVVLLGAVAQSGIE